ncbi:MULTISPECIES: hypothetical protein [Myxococcus]|uniref:hypothetical protein n=1 Tax=Myxococcus TaxID=32 RepID=UPI0013D3FE91|nr:MULTISPECIES: hypothetical protein [Myxococcus]NVJ27075.1 hypothetical protein [Myxococcus sp. AM011]
MSHDSEASASTGVSAVAAVQSEVRLAPPETGAVTPVPLPQNQRLMMLTTALPLLSLAAAWFVAPGWGYIATSLVLLAFIAVLGQSITGTPFGVLISERNSMSLSRFQAVTWTVVVVSGYLAMVIARVKTGTPNAVDVAIPQELWWAMGISSTSLLGTPLLLSGKRSKTPDAKVVDATAAQLAETSDEINAQRQGALYANKGIQDARISDMFQGDEVGNTAQIDIAKVQMFFFTAIASVSYFVDIAMSLRRGGSLTSLPELSEGLVALLAISHGGYLVSKTTDHSNSKPS